MSRISPTPPLSFCSVFYWITLIYIFKFCSISFPNSYIHSKRHAIHYTVYTLLIWICCFQMNDTKILTLIKGSTPHRIGRACLVCDKKFIYQETWLDHLQDVSMLSIEKWVVSSNIPQIVNTGCPKTHLILLFSFTLCISWPRHLTTRELLYPLYLLFKEIPFPISTRPALRKWALHTGKIAINPTLWNCLNNYSRQ